MTSRIAFWVMGILAIGVALVSWRVLALGLDASFSLLLSLHPPSVRQVLLVHAIAAPVALAVGVMQFQPRLRARRPGVHRAMGRLYALAIIAAGVTGLLLALSGADRPVAATGFGLLALAWLATTGIAVRHAVARRIAEHRRWMIRSYALTFAAVTLRLQLPLFIGFGGMDYAEASAWVAWLCWVPNLLVVEWAFRRRRSVAAVMA